MLSILFILLILAALGSSYYFTNKMSVQRKQILLLKYQNNNLKHISKTNKNKNVTVEYIFPICDEGIVKKKCELFISPIEDSAVLNFLSESTLVKIQDSATINNQLWYEVSLLVEERVNNKGWIKEDFIKLHQNISE